MLVVIALIGVLAGLVAFAVTKVIGSQQGSNTQATIRTVQKVLNEHYAYVVAEAREGETGLSGPFAAIDNVFGPDDGGGERNRIIWVKMRLMEAFPMSYAEILHPFPYTAHIIPLNLRKYNGTYLEALGGRTRDNNGGATESSACLLMKRYPSVAQRHGPESRWELWVPPTLRTLMVTATWS